MSVWESDYKNSGVWAALDRLDAGAAAALELAGIADEQVSEVDRARAVGVYLRGRLLAASPLLIRHHILPEINSSVATAADDLHALAQTVDWGRLSHANTCLDNALESCLRLPTTTAESLEDLGEAAQRYRETLTNYIATARSRTAQLEQELTGLTARQTELQNQILAEQQRMSSLITETQSQLKADRDTYQARLDGLVGQFQSGQEQRAKDHADAQTTRQAEFDKISREHTSQFQSLVSSTQERASAVITEEQLTLKGSLIKLIAEGHDGINTIKKHEAEVDKILGIIGQKSVTAGHHLAAEDAKSSRKLWQIITVAALVALAGIATKTVLDIKDFSWPALAGRVYVSIALGVLAAYSASQADRFHGVERHNRKLALELAALGPFLQPLPADQQEKFRVMIGERTFAQEDGHVSKASPATAAHVILKSKELKATIEILKALIEKPK